MNIIILMQKQKNSQEVFFMTENRFFSFGPYNAGRCSVTCESLLKDRMPCAASSITNCKEKSEGGEVSFFATPMGTAVRVALTSIPFFGEEYEPCFIEIEEKRNSRYRSVTASLPPIFTHRGTGSMTFMTDRFSAADIIGKRINFKKNDRVVASGIIFPTAK